MDKYRAEKLRYLWYCGIKKKYRKGDGTGTVEKWYHGAAIVPWYRATLLQSTGVSGNIRTDNFAIAKRLHNRQQMYVPGWFPVLTVTFPIKLRRLICVTSAGVKVT